MKLVARSRSPLRLLLYVEWILLGMAVFLSLPMAPFATAPFTPEATVLWPRLAIISLFAVMGLRLPTQRWTKIAYTVIELGLLGLLIAGGAPAPLPMRLSPQLGLVTVIRSSQMFQMGGRLVVLGLVFVVHLVTTFSRAGGGALDTELMLRLNPSYSQGELNLFKVHALVFLLLVMVFVLLLVSALLSAHRSQHKLTLAHEALRRYAAKVEGQATLQERNRIAREIHDSLGHTLTAQTILLENALLFLPSTASRTKSYLMEAKDSAYGALREVSRSVTTLRNAPLLNESLLQLIPKMVDGICAPAQIEASCRVKVPARLPEDITTALLRIAQEALTNVVKHSQATQVKVTLASRRDRLYIQVWDNGQGFDPSKNTSGFGLRGIRERAADLEGRCQIWSAPGRGCRISVTFPSPCPPLRAVNLPRG
ncbi:MAG: sensor histidine kinase [Cyanobacteria bacterium P01_A01_bin.135]